MTAVVTAGVLPQNDSDRFGHGVCGTVQEIAI